MKLAVKGVVVFVIAITSTPWMTVDMKTLLTFLLVVAANDVMVMAGVVVIAGNALVALDVMVLVLMVLVIVMFA